MERGHFLREIVPIPGEIVQFREGHQLGGPPSYGAKVPILVHGLPRLVRRRRNLLSDK